MALRVALHIDGDASGAKKALDETAAGIDNLGNKSGAAAGNTERASDAVGKLGENAKAAVPALRGIESGGERAARGIVDTGDAADVANGKLGTLGRTIGGLAAGLAAGAAIYGLTTAVGVLTSAVGGYISELVDPSGRIERALKGHQSLIDGVKQKYIDAARGVADYNRVTAAGMRFEAQQNVARLEREERTSLGGMDLRGRRQDIGGLSDTGMQVVAESFGPFEEAVERFRGQLAAGKADVNGFRDEIAKIAGDLPKESDWRAVGEGLRDTTNDAGNFQTELSRARDVVAGLEGDSNAAAMALGTLPKGFQDAGDAARAQAEGVAAFVAQLRELGGAGGLAATPAAGAIGAQPFAAGGIVDRPTLFRYGGDRLGLMGEAGPEAIMPLAAGRVGALGPGGRETSLPLARLSSGRLGVRAFAQGGVIGGGALGQARGGMAGFILDLTDGASAAGAVTMAAAQLGVVLTPARELATEMARINELLATGAIGWEEYRVAAETATIEASATIGSTLRTEMQMREQVGQLAVGLLTTIGSKNKAAAVAALALSKGIAIAQTIHSTAAASMAAFLPPPVGFGPLGGAAAAASIKALGAVQIGLIAATGLAQGAQALGSSSSPNGKGGGGRGEARNHVSSADPSYHQASTTPATITIHMTPGRYTPDDIRELLDQFNEALRDGAKLNVKML